MGMGPPFDADEVALIDEKMKTHPTLYVAGMGVRPANNAPAAGYEYVGAENAATHVVAQWAIAELQRDGAI